MLEINGVEFKGRAYIASTTKGTWAFSEMPVKTEDGEYMISEEFRNREAFIKISQLKGDLLPILFGEPENYDKNMAVNSDGIYKVSIEKIDEQPNMIQSALDLIKQPIVMMGRVVKDICVTNDICVITNFDNQWGLGQSLMDDNFGESCSYFLDHYVLYNGKLNEKQTKLVFDLCNK
jgi:hypothetical protein